MSEHRQQALIRAPAGMVWELIGNPERYPEWWPKLIEIRDHRFEEDETFIQVSRGPFGKDTTTFVVDERDPLRHLRMHCTQSGMYLDWTLAEAMGDTFVDTRLGMDPTNIQFRLFDWTLGRRYLRAFLRESVAALERAAAADRPAARA
jgi:uncharacterized protein YndB with AHSA1/START domain